MQGQGCGLPGTSFLSRGFGSLALAAEPQSGQRHTAALQSQGFRQTLGACVLRGSEPCHEGGEGEVRLSLGGGEGGQGTWLPAHGRQRYGCWGTVRHLGQMKQASC